MNDLCILALAIETFAVGNHFAQSKASFPLYKLKRIVKINVAFVGFYFLRDRSLIF